jgi:hypothetical protein
MKISQAVARLYRAGRIAGEVERFAGVRSVPDCIKIFEDLELIEVGGLGATALSDLVAICKVMRARGWSLEPNLIGRAACLSILEPGAAGSASLKLAVADTDFIVHQAEASAQQTNKALHEAEFAFFRCLELFPCHSGILVQYAHSLKDQDKMVDAVVVYLDALAYGAPPVDVHEHLLFASKGIGLIDRVEAMLRQNRRTIPSRHCRVLHEVLTGQQPQTDGLLERILSASSSDDYVASILGSDDFRNSNKALLMLVAESGVGASCG